MNTLIWTLGVLAAVCAAWHVAATIMIYDQLRRRGQKVSFIWLRVLGPAYASRYREVTKQETGHVGSLFYQWVISINLVAVLILAAVVAYAA